MGCFRPFLRLEICVFSLGVSWCFLRFELFIFLLGFRKVVWIFNVRVWSVSCVIGPVSYTHLRAHETRHDLVCRLLLEKKNKNARTKLPSPITQETLQTLTLKFRNTLRNPRRKMKISRRRQHQEPPKKKTQIPRRRKGREQPNE